MMFCEDYSLQAQYIDTILDQCCFNVLRHWPNTNPALGPFFVFAVNCFTIGRAAATVGRCWISFEMTAKPRVVQNG